MMSSRSQPAAGLSAEDAFDQVGEGVEVTFRLVDVTEDGLVARGEELPSDEPGIRWGARLGVFVERLVDVHEVVGAEAVVQVITEGLVGHERLGQGCRVGVGVRDDAPIGVDAASPRGLPWP